MDHQTSFELDIEQQCVLEALLFVSGESLSIQEIAATLELSLDQTEEMVCRMEQHYEQAKRGLRLMRFANQVQLCSAKEYAPYVEKCFSSTSRQRLSQASLETLSIIAYRQPITRAEVDLIRGVKSDYSISTLVSKGLIQECGRRETLGRPILYGTTITFLQHFGLHSLDELPPLPERIQATGQAE